MASGSQYMQQLNQFSKQTSQNTTNALGHLSMVQVTQSLNQNLVRQANRNLQEYHKLIELFRQELTTMKNRIDNTNEQISNTTNPLVEALYRELERSMLNQKQENLNFQDQITDLKKEKSIINQMIIATNKRTQQLNQEVGHY